MDSDLVVLDLRFADETWEISAPITRLEARTILRVVGEQGTPWGPYNKRVVWAKIVEYEFDANATFDPERPVH